MNIQLCVRDVLIDTAFLINLARLTIFVLLSDFRSSMNKHTWIFVKIFSNEFLTSIRIARTPVLIVRLTLLHLYDILLTAYYLEKPPGRYGFI